MLFRRSYRAYAQVVVSILRPYRQILFDYALYTVINRYIYIVPQFDADKFVVIVKASVNHSSAR